MSTVLEPESICVALLGNPNTGKSTLFSALCGVRQRVGNYPGVTVERKIGWMRHSDRRFQLVDLPGTYSLAPRSPDEMVAVDVLLGRRADSPKPQAVLCIVDASNLERNLYLVSQVLEMALPTVVALNMTDVAERRGHKLNVARLERQLGARIVPIQANRGVGLDALKRALADAATGSATAPDSPFPPAFRAEVERLGTAVNSQRNGDGPLPRFLIERLLLDASGYLEEFLLAGRPASLGREVLAARERLKAGGMPVPAVEAIARYGWVAKVAEGVVQRSTTAEETLTDRVDRLLTHRVWGLLFFLLMMFVVFESVFLWPAPQLMEWIDGGMAALGEVVSARMPDGTLKNLVVDGVLSGVGGVVIFLPQILVLFFFLGLLEDCGYMARAAYLMDRLMSRVGLSGKSFIPLLSSFACAIPGIMATRVIENRRDRFTTILVAPLMSCSARLPVYILLVGAFVPPLAWLGGVVKLKGLVMLAMYLLGMVAAAIVALVLKRTLLRGPTPPFVMELPSYKWPSPRTLLFRMVESGWAFIYRAGTLIVAVSILVWAALYYPRHEAEIEAQFGPERARLEQLAAALPERDPRSAEIEEQRADLENQIAGFQERHSFLGQAGHWIEPVVKPLGWDWRIGSAAIASFPAREVVVATLGVIYDLGGEVDLEDEGSRSRLEAALQSATWDGSDPPRKVFNLPVALSIMVFFALCAQCASTLVIIRRETQSWRWPAFTFVYMTALAYVAALVTYQAGMLLGG